MGGAGGRVKTLFYNDRMLIIQRKCTILSVSEKKIILQQHSSRGAQGKLHLRFLINVLKERGDVKITPFLVYKKAAHFLQIIQAISAAS